MHSRLLIKTGSHVKVMVGKDKGKEGKVLQTFPKLGRVVVEGVNMTKRHLKNRRGDDRGQIVEFPMPVHVSNVQPVNADGKPVRHHLATRA